MPILGTGDLDVQNRWHTRVLCLATLAQRHLADEWAAFPGDNSNRIVQVIRDKLQAAVNLQTDPEAALSSMRDEVQALLD